MKLFSGNIIFCFCISGILIFFSGCSKKSADIPKNILTKEELVPVLVDIHLAQAYTGMNQLTDSSRVTMYDYAAYIFNAHHITKQKYDSAMAFYTFHPDLLNEIYQDVINELSKKQSESERK